MDSGLCVKHALCTCASLAGIGVLVTLTGARERLTAGVGELDRADPAFLALAAVAFACGLACCGLAWRAGLEAAGTRRSGVDATSRYVAGSLVNSLVPLRAGGAVRLSLYLRVAGIRAVATVASSIGAQRASALAILVAIASKSTSVPAWPGAILVVVAVAAIVAAAWLGGSSKALRATAPWMVGATLARVSGAAAVGLAFGAPEPVFAGVAIVVATELASTLPLAPGNVALSSAAVAFVLTALGLPDDVALAAGLALALLETSTAVVFGLAGLGYLTGFIRRPQLPEPAVPGARRRLSTRTRPLFGTSRAG